MNRKLFGLFALLLGFAWTSMLHAQTVTGTLTGRVLDQSAAALGKPKITVKNEQTGLVRTAYTNDEGYYTFSFLPLGRYSVTVGMDAFQTLEKTGVEVNLNETTVSDFTLRPAAVSAVVSVSAEVPQIETTSGDFKITLTAKEIEDRPLPTRNFLALTETVPGFQENAVSGQNNPTASSGSSVQFNGTGTRGATFQINGVNNDDNSENQNRQGVNISTIAATQVLTNNFSAEFGRGYGTVVLVQTKQGTNGIHGDAFWFHTNSATTARDYFSPVTTNCPSNPAKQCPFQVPKNRRHDFGGTVGGPIFKDKLFFYGSYEGIRSGGGQTFIRDIFTPAEKAAGPDPSVTNPGDRAFIQKILIAFPNVAPNAPLFSPRAYTTGIKFHFPDNDYTGRIDWNISQRNTLTARYQYSHQDRASDEVIKYEQTVQNNTQQNVGVTMTHIFSASQTGEFRLGIGRRETRVDILDGNDAPILRVSNPFANPPYFSGTIIGNAGNFPIHRFQTDWQFVYNHFWVATPKWSIRVGTDIRPSQLNDLSDSFTRGFWTISDTGRPSGINPYHDAYFEFLHGLFGATGTFTKSYGAKDLANNMKEANFYLQADWKATPAVTLNFGLRDEWVNATRERNQKVNYGYDATNNINPRFGFAWSPRVQNGPIATLTGGPGKFVIRGGFGMFAGRLFQSYFSQGGASIRFTPPNGVTPSFDVTLPQFSHVGDPTNGFVFQPGTFPQSRVAITAIAPNLRTPYTEQWNLTMQRELPGQMALTVSYIGNRGIGLPFYNLTNRARFPFTAPIADKFFANDPARAWAGITFDCVYDDVNQKGPDTPALGQTHQCISLATPYTTQRRPDAHFGSNFLIRNGSWSYYSGLQAILAKRPTHGLSYNFSYTFGHAIDTGSETTFTGIESNVPLTEFSDASSMRGNSLFDQTHRFTINYAYELPWVKNQRVESLDRTSSFLANLVGRVLGGWQLNGTTLIASGNPFTVTAGYDLNGDGVSNDHPDLVDRSVLGASVNDGHFLAGTTCKDRPTACQHSQLQLPVSAFFPNYTTAARSFRPGTTNVGTLGRNTFRGPRRLNFDLALQKSFKVAEGQRLIFRWEAYNVMNHPQFQLPSTTSALNTSFMRITSQRNYRVDTGTGARYMQFAFRYVF